MCVCAYADLARSLALFLNDPSSFDLEALCIIPGRSCWVVYVDALVCLLFLHGLFCLMFFLARWWWCGAFGGAGPRVVEREIRRMRVKYDGTRGVKCGDGTLLCIDPQTVKTLTIVGTSLWNLFVMLVASLFGIGPGFGWKLGRCSSAGLPCCLGYHNVCLFLLPPLFFFVEVLSAVGVHVLKKNCDCISSFLQVPEDPCHHAGRWGA